MTGGGAERSREDGGSQGEEVWTVGRHYAIFFPIAIWLILVQLLGLASIPCSMRTDAICAEQKSFTSNLLCLMRELLLHRSYIFFKRSTIHVAMASLA